MHHRQPTANSTVISTVKRIASNLRDVNIKDGKHMKEVATSLYNYGNLLRDHLHRPSEAEAAYKRALEIEPNTAACWYNYGILLKSQSRLVETEAAYKRALELKPDHAKCWYNYGNLLATLQRPAEAENAYKHTLETEPNNAGCWKNYGILLEEQDAPRMQDALSCYHKAAALGKVEVLSWAVEIEEKLSVRRAAQRRDYLAARLAINKGDPVEVISKTGKWLPARVVEKFPSGYTLRLTNECVITRIAPERIRRPTE